MPDEQAIEKMIQEKGKIAPRITPTDLDNAIVSDDFYVFPNTTMTVCALTLKNGYVVVGKSAAASPENYDQAIGRRVARENARNQIWELEGYRLKSELSKEL